MKNYQKQRDWSDQYTAQAIEIIQHNSHRLPPKFGVVSGRVATMEEDVKQATDAVVFTAMDYSFGLRVRAQNCIGWRNDFTLRNKTRFGAKTEMQKVCEGFPRMYFYAIAKEDQNPAAGFAHWKIIDMSTFRAWLLENSDRRKNLKNNNDGTAFEVFNMSQCGRLRSCVVAESDGKNPNQFNLF